MWPLAAAAAAAAYLLYTLLRFARADADLALLSRRAPPPGAYHGKVVWVVGASQGLGLAVAERFAALGARLILSSRSPAALAAAAARCAAVAGAAAEPPVLLPLDVTCAPEELAAAVAAAFSAFSGAGVDVVVHCVGASQHAAAEETAPHVAAALLDVNLGAPLALAAACLPRMLAAGRGRHVAVASMSAVVASPGQAVYAAAKAGLRAYFASAASELAARGVGATLACPGPLAAPEGAPARRVFGAAGPVAAPGGTGLSGNRVTVERAAELISTATYHGMREVWIARHPVLLLGYLSQYAPWAAAAVMRRVGPARAAALRAGRSGYDAAGLLRAAGKGA
jgi:dehydrogenase/reductase SDR family protein 7